MAIGDGLVERTIARALAGPRPTTYTLTREEHMAINGPDYEAETERRRRDAGLLDKANRRITALETHCAWMQRELEAMVRRLTTLECSLARVEQRLDANDEGAARLEELAIARAKRAAY